MALACGRSIDKNLYRAPSDEATKPETLMEEMAQLQKEKFPFPNEVRSIVEPPRKNILFSFKPLLWVKVKPLYIYLTEKKLASCGILVHRNLCMKSKFMIC